jgi:hypothetical protein
MRSVISLPTTLHQQIVKQPLLRLCLWFRREPVRLTGRRGLNRKLTAFPNDLVWHYV